MGKNNSGEPASKKLKQSQLCFKSPKAANGNLKSKMSPLNDSLSKSTKINSPEVSKAMPDISESQMDVLPCNESGYHHSSTEKIVTSLDSASENKKNCSGKNTLQECAIEDSSVSEKDVSMNEDTPDHMDVDESSPNVTSSATQESNNEVQTINSENTDRSPIRGKCSDISTTVGLDSPPKNDSSKAFESLEVSCAEQTPSKNDYSTLADTSVASLNDSGSLSDSNCNISSDSEKESGTTSTSSTPVTPSNQNKKKRQMTPKLLKRHEESVRKKKLKEQLREEKRALVTKNRDEKLKMKMEEEEKKKQMIEEKKKKRLAEIELKNEEKRLKQEDKRQRKEKDEEEKKRKKEQKAEDLRKEEEKKERAQAAFVSFFKKNPSTSSCITTPTTNNSSTVSSDTPTFMPFPVKNDMRLATVTRRHLSENERRDLESVLKLDNTTNTYFEVFKKGTYAPGTSTSTWPAPVSDELHDCIIIEAEVEDQGEGGASEENILNGNKYSKITRRAKLLQFCENRRPAYFGTWTKISKEVTGRTPFAKDEKKVLDYEVDSDSEWEEEEEGEDLENVKDDENEGQEEEVVEGGENGYLLDNTFVPHGYLSDEEQPDEEDIHESAGKQDRLVALKEEFDEEMKQGGAQALKPKLLGCLWISNSTTQVSKGSLYEALLAHRAVWDESNCPEGIDMEPDSTPCNDKSPSLTPPIKKLPLIVLQELARMVDGSRWPLNKLVREVGEVLSVARPQNPVSRLALTRAIKQMASKTLDSKENSVWTIKPEYRTEYKLQELELTPVQVTPNSRVKNKDTLLDNFLRGHQQKPDQLLGAPSAKKRISLTPVLQTPSDVKMEVTPEGKKPDSNIPKKKVAFVTLPPRTPGSTPQSRIIPRTPGPWASSNQQSTLKPHVDTPRPSVNRFLNKTSPTESEDVIEISDDSSM